MTAVSNAFECGNGIVLQGKAFPTTAWHCSFWVCLGAARDVYDLGGPNED